MKMKKGVKLGGVKPEIVTAYMLVDAVYASMGLTCTLTSCTEGKHSDNSLHYTGYAGDFRTRNVPKWERSNLADKVQHMLGSDFDVILHNTHLHIEYDPE